MSLSNEEILNAIAEKSVMDIVELISAMEEKFGVSAQAAVAVAAAPAAGTDGGEQQAEEKTEFDVVLSAVGEKESKRDKGSARDNRFGFERSKGYGGWSAIYHQRSCAQSRGRRV